MATQASFEKTPEGKVVVILPVCNEAESLPQVVSELRHVLRNQPVAIVAGLNGCTDDSKKVLQELEVPYGIASKNGYGHGCQAAIDHAASLYEAISAYLFIAADGADNPSAIPEMIAKHEEGFDMVLGNRTSKLGNWRVMGFPLALANVTLGLWASLLVGRFYIDLGPLRLIDAKLLERMHLREFTWGWTIEAQVMAARLGAKSTQIAVNERSRIAGKQKVSGVSWQRSIAIAGHIVRAGWRTRWRPLR